MLKKSPSKPVESTLRQFTIRFLKPYIGRIGLFFLLIVLATGFSIASILSINNFLQILFSPETQFSNAYSSYIEEVLGKVYDYVLSYGKENALWIFSCLIFVIYLLKDVFTYLALYSISSTRNKIIRNIRNAIFRQYTALSLAFISRYRKGDLLSRINTDIIEYEESVLKALQSFISGFVMVILYLCMLIYIDLWLTLGVLLIFPLFAALVSLISRKLKRDSKNLQQKSALLTSIMEETISGLKIIKSFTAIDLMNNRFRRFNQSYTRLRNKVYRRVDLASPQSEFFGNVMVIGLLLLGSQRVLSPNPTLSAEMFIVYLILFVMIIKPAKDISTSFYSIRKGTGCVSRINEILQSNAYIKEPTDAVEFPVLQKGIRFENVNFAYNKDIPVLRNINITFEAGKTTAIVGASGSGKSTLADLIPKFHSPTDGSLFFDDINSNSLRASDIRANLAIVTQDTILFNDSVENNISFGNGIYTHEDVVRAAQVANAEEFILNLPDGYQTIIGDSGNTLSGGQRQRLSIARAVLRNAPILILDEATSALDTASERLVQDAIARITASRTSIVIAHRLSTIINADKIVVLDAGQVKEVGTHHSLYSKGGIYTRLCDMQELKVDI
ncbi:MAG: ABC transporter ATP-binding protein/permease [Bacteroidales bacterium]|jgi:subfamily B ATP-binding cassette protein MsbA|nr:ABC transporter ATP-binding protein/permease [Bacteroidales bacterium]